MKPVICILRRDTKILQQHQSLIVNDIKLLRDDLIKCRKLPCYSDCEYKEEFKNTVNQALKEIYQEWDIK